ncbi:DUF445 domain-containing protein [Sandarakinorhabdus sp. DWP1-3-1]|uniref:DUF445 domain-containing protein n=1 Tax=Sandarakinorhabdus sp. DWP1-3-1 TaxID=2804627 RepID=UPI003CF00927
MRLAATLLLFAMALVFAASLYFRDVHPALPWIQAFAEAAMVGGLADWFAVTALFRHPLGLPIPHTAIIPANKDRIGDSLAVFLRDNFLTPAIVARRLEEVDIAGAAARWLLADRTPAPGRKRGWGPLIARLIEALDQRVIGDLVREAATEKLRGVQLSPIVADAIDTTIDKRRHEPLIDSAIAWGAGMLDDQESTIRGMVAERTNWFLKLVAVDEQVSSSLIKGVRKLLVEMASDPQHPLRLRITEGLRTYAFDLRHFPDSQSRIEGFKEDLIGNPAMAHWLEGLWDSARTGLVASLTNPDAIAPGKLAVAMKALGTRLEADAPLRAAINLHLRRAAVGLVNDYGDEIVSLVSTTVRGWDASTVTEKLETAVGRDLQFIRINGTVIGGLVGLAIHAATVLL